jgi:hypothetical protein
VGQAVARETRLASARAVWQSAMLLHLSAERTVPRTTGS